MAKKQAKQTKSKPAANEKKKTDEKPLRPLRLSRARTERVDPVPVEPPVVDTNSLIVNAEEIRSARRSARRSTRSERVTADGSVRRPVIEDIKPEGSNGAAATGVLPEAKVEELRKLIVMMGEMVEENVMTAVMSLIERDVQMARDVLAVEDEIDDIELVIDEVCYKLLLTATPNEKSARFIYSSIKINMELERIGDLCVAIAHEVVKLAGDSSRLPALLDIAECLESMEEMVRDAVQALVEQDVNMAYDILERKDAVIARVRTMLDYLGDLLIGEPQHIKRTRRLIRAMNALWRIIDQTTNIAEEVIYMVEGISVKHKAVPVKKKK